ncbi:MAG TPA: GNAT family N-acetyltransferase [Pyrinomonadaceae bacterium]|nr:GNAT family N-acetyltransferase [Pyrinomonadaceae bacterium]
MTTEAAEITIRRADERDVEALVEFNRAMARETEAKELDVEVLRAGVRGLLDEPRHGFYLVAERRASDANDEGTAEVVGSLMVTYEWSDWRNGLFWWVQSVYVSPSLRRRGVYRRLYQHVKELAASDASVRGFRLYVERENVVAQRTYEQLGMEETHYKLYEELLRR